MKMLCAISGSLVSRKSFRYVRNLSRMDDMTGVIFSFASSEWIHSLNCETRLRISSRRMVWVSSDASFALSLFSQSFQFMPLTIVLAVEFGVRPIRLIKALSFGDDCK